MKDKTSKEELNDKNQKKKRPKRISKSEEEKRAQILTPILGEWVCIKNNYAENEYYYVKHFLVNDGKFSRIKQILISGYEEQDGIYEISDYEIGFIFDAATMKKKIEIRPKKYDMTYGLYSENEFAETYDDLLKYLTKEGYVTKEELQTVLTNKKFHNTCQEIVLSLVRNYRNREAK